jgi:hypothetical protein
MYIVRDKATHRIIHVNPAPVSQGLEGTDIYYRLDLATMEVGRGEFFEAPRLFDIDAQGIVVPWTLERQIKEGRKTLPPDLKAVGNDIVPKPLAEKLTDGTVKLTPTQVVDGEHIREMTQGEQAAAGLIQLEPHLKLAGKQIVPKTRADLARDKLIELASDEKIQGDEVVRLNLREMLAEGRIDLQGYKQAVIDRYTEVSLAARRNQLPDYQLLYAALGALDAATVEHHRKIAADHARALDQTTRSVQSAATADEVDKIAGLGDWSKREPSGAPPRP